MSNAFVFPELDYGDTNPSIKIVPDQTLSLSAGFNLPLSPPGSSAWRVISLRCVFLASAAVATRTLTLQIRDPEDNAFYESEQSLTATAGTLRRYIWSTAMTQVFAGATGGHAPMLDIVILPTWKLVLSVTNPQNNDELFGPSIYLIEISTTPSHASNPDIVPITPIVV